MLGRDAAERTGDSMARRHPGSNRGFDGASRRMPGAARWRVRGGRLAAPFHLPPLVATPRRAAGQLSVVEPEHMEAWPRCLERLEAELPAEDVHTWLRPLQAARRDDATVLYAPNAFVRDTVHERYMPRIRELLGFFGDAGAVSLEIGSLPRAAEPQR